MNTCGLVFIFHLFFRFVLPDSPVLIWAEEFNGTKLNNEYWSFQLGDGCPNLCGWGNDEKQIYTNTNHRIEQGVLVIEARKEPNRYTSTRISTKGKKEFKYGKIEARIQLPIGAGMWPAFWMLGANIDQVKWPKCGEIDILEYAGNEPQQVHTSLHTYASFGNTINTQKTKIKDIENGFHHYAVDWSEEAINFLIDDQIVYTFNPKNRSENVWPFDQPFYILLNLAVGGNFGNQEVDDRIFPQEMKIDYIRVYQ